jgi:CubicO group peptidase (beta-lactamase class C family)
VRWHTNTFAHVVRGGPAGGGYSTAPDLVVFAEALRGGKLVGAATAERLFTPAAAEGAPPYGLGFAVSRSPAGRVVGHGGGFDGISSNLDVFLDRGFAAVVLANQDFAAQPVVDKIRELVGRLRPER